VKSHELVIRADSCGEAPPSATAGFIDRVKTDPRHMRADIRELRPNAPIVARSETGAVDNLYSRGGKHRRVDRCEFFHGSIDGVKRQVDVSVEVQAREGGHASITLVERSGFRRSRYLQDGELMARSGEAVAVCTRDSHGPIGGAVHHHGYFEA
jgi:hypothetical protein